jgi:hypothetical protein
MHKFEKAASIVNDVNHYLMGEIEEHVLLKKVCAYFDEIKYESLNASDYKLLKYISNLVGVPHYYDLLGKFQGKQALENEFENYDLNTFSSSLYEGTLHIDDAIKIHKYQKKILQEFLVHKTNRFFLSASTSFGKTFLVYEIIKKLKYKKIVLIFPTIALLSENYEKLLTEHNYQYFRDNYEIHTLSDIDEISNQSIFIFTPERYLSFVDKNRDCNFDFVFVDEIYKLDNEYSIDEVIEENERDVSYRVAIADILRSSRDILLAGPYIKISSRNDKKLNQSFNEFLFENEFKILDFNAIEIVNKNFFISDFVDDGLQISFDKKNNLQGKIFEVTKEIRKKKENVIFYTRGAGTAEVIAYELLANSKDSYELNDDLKLFVKHLSDVYSYEKWIVIRALKKKIGIHHGLVPKYIQKEIISLFNKASLDVLISTTTITEGVNTSAKNMVVTSSLKGIKPLKKFDAKNIAGRAGRFLHHYSGRVVVLDAKFQKIIESPDDEIKHKNFDAASVKNEIDYFITNEKYLNSHDIQLKEEILDEQEKRGISEEIMALYEMIPRNSKIYLYDQINSLSSEQLLFLKNFANKIHKSMRGSIFIELSGLQVLIDTIKNIVVNQKLRNLLDSRYVVKDKNGIPTGEKRPILYVILISYFKNGFVGAVKYQVESKGLNVDYAVRSSSEMIFKTLKYEFVKYLGVFNLMYKYCISQKKGCEIDEVIGFDKLLVKLEYNSISKNGRLASDYGVPHKIVEYYDNGESQKAIGQFDEFEKQKFINFNNMLKKTD